jgi:hypothetical protein
MFPHRKRVCRLISRNGDFERDDLRYGLAAFAGDKHRNKCIAGKQPARMKWKSRETFPG